MPVEIVVPPLGESVVEATVLNWLKREGDSVAAGEPVVELETDKVNMEVYSPQAGILAAIARPAGATVAIGESLGSVEPGSAGGIPAPTAAAPPEQAKQHATDGAGDQASASTNGDGHPSATPVAQKMADVEKLDLSMIRGTGPGGKVTKDDVANYTERTADAPRTAKKIAQQAVRQVQEGLAREAVPAAVPLTAAPGSHAAVLTISDNRREERVPITRLRETIMRRLKEAQNTAAMLTTFNEIDMSAVMDVRRRRKDSFKEKHGVNLGFMSFFAKAVVGALKAFPYLNAEILEKEILLKHYYDIGVAVSTERGLVVPVLRDVDSKSFADIEKGIVDVATRARENKLTLPDLAGGTFTITNGGTFGSLMSTPILNTPQVGILGMHKIQDRPVALNGEVVIRPMMYVALSYDHRIVDGSEAVRFLVRVKDLLEDPENLLLEG